MNSDEKFGRPNLANQLERSMAADWPIKINKQNAPRQPNARAQSTSGGRKKHKQKRSCFVYVCYIVIFSSQSTKIQRTSKIIEVKKIIIPTVLKISLYNNDS